VKDVTKLSKLENASFIPGDEAVRLTFSGDRGSIEFEINRKDLESMLRSLTGLLAHTWAQEAQTRGSQAVSLLPLAGFRASSLADHDAICLTFETAAGLPFHFSIPLESTDQLCTEIQRAVQTGRSKPPSSSQPH
jgi:hypothetical protein